MKTRPIKVPACMSWTILTEEVFGYVFHRCMLSPASEIERERERDECCCTAEWDCYTYDQCHGD